MVALDFDGTLGRSCGQPCPNALRLLTQLGHHGVVRVLATGRNLRSALRGLPATAPLDYVVAGSGAVVVRFPSLDVAFRSEMGAETTAAVGAALQAAGASFFVLAPPPDSHQHRMHETPAATPDFYQRLRNYAEETVPLTPDHLARPCTQFLVVSDAERTQASANALASLLAARRSDSAAGVAGDTPPAFRVVRTTSPMDHVSSWLEVLPAGASKSAALAFVADLHGIAAADAVAVGNDYNDEDMLCWAGVGRVVANAPADLRARFRATTASHDEGGVAEALLEHFAMECASDDDSLNRGAIDCLPKL